MRILLPTLRLLALVRPPISAHWESTFGALPCLEDGYRGTQGDASVFLVPSECLNTDAIAKLQGSLSTDNGLEVEIVGELPLEMNTLFWFEKQQVDFGNGYRDSDVEDEELNQFLDSIPRLLRLPQLSSREQLYEDGFQEFYNDEDEQLRTAFADVGGEVETLYIPTSSSRSHLFATYLHSQFERGLDLQLPPLYRMTLLFPTRYTPLSTSEASYLAHLAQNLEVDAQIGKVVESIDTEVLRKDVRYLSGEDPTSDILSRHSFGDGARKAAQWIKEQIEGGGGVACELKTFRFGYAPNVICTYNATSPDDPITLFSAHYDSRGSWGSLRAPGADDDGSGTTAILSLARTISKNKVHFRSPVQLALFAGEEQGLVGSHYYARELKDKETKVRLMVQADMLAYRKEGEEMQLGLPDRIGSTDAANLVTNISSLYSPELKVGYTSACCSDHQSFHTLGYISTQVFERAGPIADPMYHNSGDLSERPGYDFNQLRAIAKVQLATLLHTAGYDIGE